MIRLFVRHSVADFPTWRQAYDDFDAERQGMGVTGHAVFQSADDPNDVTIFHDFESMETAQAFMASARLRAVMEKAGVSGEPSIWFTTPA
jgi:quinol monooxygenase YgiN